MAYAPAETSPRDRVRGRVGDTDDPPLLTGGEARYDAILLRHPAQGRIVMIDGVSMDAGEALASAEAARALAGQLRLAAQSLGSSGESIAYGDRATGLEALAARYAAAATSGGGRATGGAVAVEVIW